MYKLLDLNKFEDDRGILTKIFTDTFIKKLGIDRIEESYLITFNKKDIIRGEHFHEKTSEIFHVIHGICSFELVENNKINKIILDSKESKAIMIMPKTPHRIIAKKDNSIVLAITSKEYNVNDKDTFKYNF
tara:strand:+ start:59 stop:451 length:393 start_codon:yes stop_codon:yes gene_type:complete